jgi:hypothetical protein
LDVLDAKFRDQGADRILSLEHLPFLFVQRAGGEFCFRPRPHGVVDDLVEVTRE